MVSLHASPSIHHTWLLNPSSQLGLYRHGLFRRNISFIVRSEHGSSSSTSPRKEDRPGRRQLLALEVTIAPWFLFSPQTSMTLAAEARKGFTPVMYKKDGYTFLYPFGWQEVVVEGEETRSSKMLLNLWKVSA